VEGDSARLLNPLSNDSSVYSYGTDHAILESRYRRQAKAVTQVQVTGRDSSGDPVVADSFDWTGLARYDRRLAEENPDLATLAECQAQGAALLRKADIDSAGGLVRAAVNCGQQLYDVIDITDAPAGLSQSKRRVLGLKLVYDTRRGIYEQQIELGAA
jgi:hypothetical protein